MLIKPEMAEETIKLNKKPDNILERFCDKWKINKNLIMLKLTLFVLYGATSSLIPYLTIHMQSVGLTIEEIGMIYLALPFTTFLAPPLTGFLVDKFGHYKPVVIISFILNAIFHHALLLIPHMETPGVVPPAYMMTHPNTGAIELWWSPCPSRECPNEQIKLDIVLDKCVNHCLLSQNTTFINETNIIIHNDTNQEKQMFSIELKMHSNLRQPVEVLGIEIEQEGNVSATEYKKTFTEHILKASGVNITALDKGDLRCGGVVLNIINKHVKAACLIQQCNFQDGGPEVCPADYMESDDSIFWIYFALRFAGTVMLSAGVTIMDPIALTMIEKYGGDFGRARLFSSFGMALFSPITGFLIDKNSRRLGYTDYSAAFYTYDILLVISAITLYLMPLSAKLPADDIFRNMMAILAMPRVVLFITFLFVLGNLWGFIESFLFLYLKDLGAPNYLLGVTVTVGTVSSIPFLYGAEKITKKIGHVNVIIIAFFAHAGRLVGYSFLETAWWCFPFEAMESLAVHLMWVAAATYCAHFAPKNVLATLIGVVGMAHFSIGRGSGSFLGGNLIGKVGIRESFRIMGLVAVTAGLLYSILNFFWLRKIQTTGFLGKNDGGEFTAENEKLNNQLEEPKFKNASTMVSFERLSLVMEYNAIGSLTSLGRRNSRSVTNEHTLISRARSASIRRGSYTSSWMKTKGASASKVDLLKSSAADVNQSNHSNPQLKYSNAQANTSISKLSQKSFTSIPENIDQERVTRRDSILEQIEEIIDDKTKNIPNSNKLF